MIEYIEPFDDKGVGGFWSGEGDLQVSKGLGGIPTDVGFGTYPPELMA